MVSLANGNFGRPINLQALENRSPTTIIIGLPSSLGNTRMKSMDFTDQGLDGMGRGWSRPAGFILGSLFCAHTWQAAT